MKVRDLIFWLETIEDQDREVPIDVVIGTMDRETEERLLAFLHFLFIYSRVPAVQNEAMALIIRLTIP